MRIELVEKNEALKSIKPCFILELGCFVEVYEDNYNKGYRKNVNSFEYPKSTYVLYELSKKKIKSCIENYIDNNNILWEKYNINEMDIIDNRLCTGQTVDNDNYRVNDYIIEKWKNNQIELYAQDINIFLNINNEPLTEEQMAEIFA